MEEDVNQTKTFHSVDRSRRRFGGAGRETRQESDGVYCLCREKSGWIGGSSSSDLDGVADRGGGRRGGIVCLGPDGTIE